MSDPLIALARQIAQETGRSVPTPNPDGPTVSARVMFVLRDPGATPTTGANETGLLDPYTNRDATSARQRNLLAQAGIDPRLCVWWNASPYHLGYKTEIKPADLARGSRYLLEAVSLCPDLKVVVAMGRDAARAATHAWNSSNCRLPRLMILPHPTVRGRGGAEGQAKLKDGYREIAQLIAR